MCKAFSLQSIFFVSPLCPDLDYTILPTAKSGAWSRLKVRKKIAFFPDNRNHSRYWKMRHKVYNIPHVWLALFSPVYTKHLWALPPPPCALHPITVLIGKEGKGNPSHMVWLDLDISHMHKKTVIPAVSLFFPACVLSFSYPQSSKKAYQSPFPQK